MTDAHWNRIITHVDHMNLKTLRIAAHLTQTELGEMAEVNQATISAIETGRTKRALHETLDALATVLSRRLERTVTTSEIAPKRAPFLVSKKKR